MKTVSEDFLFISKISALSAYFTILIFFFVQLVLSYQKKVSLEKAIRDAIAVSIEEPSREGNLFVIRQILKGFDISQSDATICVNYRDISFNIHEKCLDPKNYIVYKINLTDDTLSIKVILSFFDKLFFISLFIIVSSSLFIIWIYSKLKSTYSNISEDIQKLLDINSSYFYYKDFKDIHDSIRVARLREIEIEELKAKIFHTDKIRQLIHDINSPLSALAIIADSQDLKNLKSGNLLINSIQRIYGIFKNLSKNEMHKVASKKDIVYVNKAIKEIIQEKIFINENLTFDEKIPEESYLANINETEFKRVISNILNNSIEAIGFNGKIIVKVELTHGVISIAIEDNGTGIASSDLDKIFLKDFTTKQAGQGLGLYHSKKTILDAGGDIFINSILGKGTKVDIILPRATVDY